ncbi:MAG: hypothetical protein JO329_19820, partial [Planctomycetaceae bacterium]|nr:hypothetical protein [Planctomycetaceae bacterium]
MTLTPEARCAIPRSNARHPGPETRLDALKHGLRAEIVALPGGATVLVGARLRDGND